MSDSYENSAVFYVTAHEDDWELFRGQQAYVDLHETAARAVFIYTTAGDAGLRVENGVLWWVAREAGAIKAEFVAAPPVLRPTMDVFTANNHPISRYQLLDPNGSVRIASYHMRLPDGNMDGSGFEATGWESLKKLQDEGKAINAVDGSTTYTSWDDFCLTLAAILEYETARTTNPQPWVNAADWSEVCSPRDHSDHKETAYALQAIYQANNNPYNRCWFVTYSTDDRPANLGDPLLQEKRDVWLAYANEVQALTKVPPDSHEWDMWGAKNYFRRVPAGQADPGTCS